jgi:hypothetical protein
MEITCTHYFACGRQIGRGAHVRCGLICFKKCSHKAFENEFIITLVNILKIVRLNELYIIL